jgi:phosphoadenosine phosphosulfate reductase
MSDLKAYNKRYDSYSIYERMEQLYKDFDEDDIMLTSAFSSYSAILLKVISDINHSQVIYFIDTGHYFKETLDYKDYLTNLYQLNIVSISASDEQQLKCNEQELWLHKPNDCCYFNRVKPLEEVKQRYKIWVSGVMKWQTANRSRLSLFEPKSNMIKFHPLLDMDITARDEFIKSNDLPPHPLRNKGYDSIGCSHCTKIGKGRSGRWEASDKTECGLHL